MCLFSSYALDANIRSMLQSKQFVALILELGAMKPLRRLSVQQNVD